MKHHASILLTSLCLLAPAAKAATLSPAIVRSEFIFDKNPVPSCHATTLVQANDGSLVASWFAGTHEKNPDVCIWTARCIDGKWSAPEESFSPPLPATTA